MWCLLNITYALQKAGLLAKVSNTGTIVVREHLIAEDGVRDLRCVHQIHLEETSLKVTLLRLVLLESVKKERGRRLDHVLRHKDVDNLEKTISDEFNA